jgi:IS5 family transposase
MAGLNVAPHRNAQQVGALLDLPEIAELIATLDETRWTGRPGYPVRAMVGMALVKGVYALPTWSRTARLVADHDGLRQVLGGIAPSVYACYRFAAKLREHGDALDICLDSALTALRTDLPEMGKDVAIDGSDLPAYGNGMRYLYKDGPERKSYADPDATWGHRSAISTRKGGGFYGFKIHAAVCTRTGLPLAWTVQTASESEHTQVPILLDDLISKGFATETVAMDKGYDGRNMYEACEDRGMRPIIPLKQTLNVFRGEHKPPTCDHGVWTFAGSDAKRGAAKYRCPTGECQPASVWIKADRLHTLVPRETPRWKSLYKGRTSVEREFGHLKHEWAMLPLRVRGRSRVALHVDLTILARLGALRVNDSMAARAA